MRSQFGTPGLGNISWIKARCRSWQLFKCLAIALVTITCTSRKEKRKMNLLDGTQQCAIFLSFFSSLYSLPPVQGSKPDGCLTNLTAFRLLSVSFHLSGIVFYLVAKYFDRNTGLDGWNNYKVNIVCKKTKSNQLGYLAPTRLLLLLLIIPAFTEMLVAVDGAGYCS